MSEFKLSIIVPVYNESDSVRTFYGRLKSVLDQNHFDAEIIFVNDGSQDDSFQILREIRQKDPSIKIIDFSRNFGHQAAVKAGIDFSVGDAVIIIDADLQDPPEAIAEMVAKWREGYDVVYAQRAARKGENVLKKATASLFYRFIRSISEVNIPLDTGDFRLISRRVADVVKNIKERNIYLRGLVSWVGFRQIGILIHRDPRFAGHTKYSLRKMLKLAWDGVTHFSFLPLQVSTYLGILSTIACILWIFQAVYVRFVLHVAVPGWTSLMVAVLFLGGVQLITLGILGSYVARNYDESRSRPLYILKNSEGF